MEKNNIIIILGAIALLVVGGIIAYSSSAPKGPGQYDEFAQCLKEKGATFYGAFWCPHCREQKRMFGSSAQYLNYVECSTPDGRGQTPVCKEKGITSYPTWIFADGATSSGTLSLDTLASRTGCVLQAAQSPENP
jgi:hypothetical protein